MPPPPKCSRNDGYLGKQWTSYLKMSFIDYRYQLEEEAEVVMAINDELKERENDTRYNASAKIMANYKKFPKRSSDPVPSCAFIINKARAYYASCLNDWKESFTGYPMVNGRMLLDEIEAECRIRFTTTHLGSYYLSHQKEEYDDPILHEWAIHWRKEYDNSWIRNNEKPEVAARLVHFFENMINMDHAAELYHKLQIELPKSAAKSYPRVSRQTKEDFQLAQRCKMAS